MQEMDNRSTDFELPSKCVQSNPCKRPAVSGLRPKQVRQALRSAWLGMSPTQRCILTAPASPCAAGSAIDSFGCSTVRNPPAIIIYAAVHGILRRAVECWRKGHGRCIAVPFAERLWLQPVRESILCWCTWCTWHCHLISDSKFGKWTRAV